MLTDTALRNLKPKSLTYKASDRDGMYVTVSPTGTVTFRYDYPLNGRRETLTIGRYGPAGISLAMAREKLIDAKKAVAQGKSPALEKQREKRRLTAAKTFGDVAEKWLAGARMADSTKAMRKSIVDRDILPAFQNRQLNEITADDLRALCSKVKARGAPATAVHVRDIVKQVYAFAILHGEKVDNPAEGVGAASIATFVPKDRALSPLEIRLMARQMESVATYPTIRLALRMILLTLVRKSELIQATWDEVDFESATWTIPKQRMKGRNPHVVYLSRQALDIFVALHTCAAGSKFVLPSRYDAERCMSNATLNRVTQIVAERAKAAGLPLEPFTVHDLRRTGSTLLNEIGFNRDWIGFAEVQVLDFADLYAGKLAAALSRQHPRDLFDVGLLLQDGRADEALWRTFLVYLTCSPKPAWEMLAPRVPADFEATFDAHFKGMTTDPIEVGALLESRERLLSRVAAWLDEPSRAFLQSVEDEQPDFSLIGLAHAADLPGVRRKLHNLGQRTAAKRAADRGQLADALARIMAR